MEEWKDMKDAPKDGTEILAWCENEFRKGAEIIKWNSQYSSWCDTSDSWGWDEDSVKGWMNLPPKPKKKKHHCIDGLFECKENYKELGLIIVDCQGHWTSVKVCPFCGQSSEEG